MEIKDLRIGNYISPLGIGYTKVEGFCIWDNLIQSSDFAERGIEDFEPIQLTEEWLLKFGFEKEIDKLSISIYDNICISFFCYEHDDDFITLTNLNLEGNNVIHNELKNIKYIHQLQNLYFALTGKELAKV